MTPKNKTKNTVKIEVFGEGQRIKYIKEGLKKKKKSLNEEMSSLRMVKKKKEKKPKARKNENKELINRDLKKKLNE